MGPGQCLLEKTEGKDDWVKSSQCLSQSLKLTSGICLQRPNSHVLGALLKTIARPAC